MKFNIYLISAGITLLFFINSCSKDAYDFQSYLNGEEKIYPGLPNQISAAPGNYRVKLSWHPSPDPSVTNYKIFWNNGADSLGFASSNHNTSETISTVIKDLVEYSYSFTVYSYDAAGNRSVPVLVNNVKIYGDSYKSSLTNRFINIATPYSLTDNGITLYFDTPDTINTGTEVKYTLKNGLSKSLTLKPDEDEITLNDYQPGTNIYYQSAYKPVSSAIDTFYTHGFDSLSNIMIPVDKSLFAEVKLPNDVGTYTDETGVKNIWDGNTTPTDYPDIFHSDGNQALPHHLTFDMGKAYTGLTQFEIIGRGTNTGDHNPLKFEIWGIDDLTNAATLSPSTSDGWAAESAGRGWVLLKEVNRTGNGIAPYRVTLNETTKPIRYIRLRILAVASGNTSYSNISEVSFWYK